ncbi:MAG: glucosamine-6-phosphate deaminase [Coriobacteriia bacterium]|nr:glucosamine-6-phosphate deaminase [Coriobacteriia bacterium]
MKVIVGSTQEIAEKGAQQYVELLAKKPNAVLGLATGSTPEPLYAELIKLHKEGKISFADARTFNLDEYCGLQPTHPQSYRYFMQDKLFDHVDIKAENTRVPDGLHTTPENVEEYDRDIALAGGIDLQLLGIGVNGHIAFNEPGTPWGSLTQIVELTEKTREVNSRFFDSIDDVPTHAVCMGIRTIMNTKDIVLYALGENKAEAIKKTVYGKISKKCPSSILQLHPSVTVYCDEAAGSLL